MPTRKFYSRFIANFGQTTSRIGISRKLGLNIVGDIVDVDSNYLVVMATAQQRGS